MWSALSPTVNVRTVLKPIVVSSLAMYAAFVLTVFPERSSLPMEIIAALFEVVVFNVSADTSLVCYNLKSRFCIDFRLHHLPIRDVEAAISGTMCSYAQFIRDLISKDNGR